MCDYSLMIFPNRLANEGEVLVTHKFSTGSIGFVSPVDLCTIQSSPQCRKTIDFWNRVKAWFLEPPAHSAIPAVCIPPGARLKVQSVPGIMRRRFQAETGEEVIFTEVTASWGQFRDGLRTKDRQEILLQFLGEGVRVRVVSLAPPQEAPESEEYALEFVPAR